MGMPGNFSVKAVGMSFVDSYPDNIYRLNEIATVRYLDPYVKDDVEPIPVVLIRNPDNEKDSNAIEIHVPALGDPGMIGHVPAAIARRLAPCLDDDEAWVAQINKVAIHPDHPENPGIHLQITRVGFQDSEPF